MASNTPNTDSEERRVPRKKTPKPDYGPQNRTLNQLGVKDLRELLDRRRAENLVFEVNYFFIIPHLILLFKQRDNKMPPPEAPYDYLKDSLRENNASTPPIQQQGRASTTSDKNKNKSLNKVNTNFLFGLILTVT